jgi:hypothetical protein
LIETNKSILIIAVPRSGSTSLCNAFGKSFFAMFEPLNMLFRPKIDTKTFIEQISKKNIVVKTMPDHLPYDWKAGDYLNFIKTIIPYFDHVILLDRKNIKEQYDSYIKLVLFIEKQRKGDFLGKSNSTEKRITLAEKFFWLQKYLIREISINYNLKIYFYEDIFFDNYESIFNELRIDIDLIDRRYLDPKYRYKDHPFKVEFPKNLI